MTTALATASNSAIPIWRRKGALDADIAGITKHAAGVLHVAPDASILLLRRAGVEGQDNFVGHWALPGGGVDDGETPEQGAVRENREEMGVDVDPTKLRALDRTKTPNGMAFHTFAHPAAVKFSPTLNEEHSGSGWFGLHELPRPLHPSVEKTLREQVGLQDDMSPDDAKAAGTELAAWAAQPMGADEIMRIDLDDEDGQLAALLAYIKENSEVGHSFGVVVDPEDKELAKKFYIDGDGAFRIRSIGTVVEKIASDSACILALDKDSVREKDPKSGRLIVKMTNISKANVCPYRGAEIPGWEALGLEPDRVYNLLRDPDELKKAAPTLNGVQLLRKHIPVSAKDHQPYDTVGSVGSNAEFDGTYLTNSIYVNAQDAIDDIESKKKRELSAGYHYKPDMTPGNFGGKAFDGIMRDIVFNHVALVEDGRAGPDVMVGDSMENVMAKPTRMGKLVLLSTAAAVAPLLAMDSKVTLPTAKFAGLTSKNFKASKPALIAAVRSVIDGKLRAGLALDASMAGLAKAIDAFEDMDDEAVDTSETDLEKVASVDPVAAEVLAEKKDDDGVFDSADLMAFLKGKGMSDEDIAAACAMLPASGATDEAETPEEKAAREKKEAEAAAAKDAEMKDMVTKPAMDQAISVAVSAATKAVRETERGIRQALAEVVPYVGEIPASMAFDSAADVRRHALTMLGVEGAKTIHADALAPVLAAQKKIGSRTEAVHTEFPMGMDSATVDAASKYAPGLSHIEIGG